MFLLVGEMVMTFSSSSGVPDRTGRRMERDAEFQGERGGVIGEGDLVKGDAVLETGEVWVDLVLD